MKYVDAVVTFSEIPDEITLCLNISNCPCKCPGCHSKYLWEDIGNNLTKAAISDLMASNRGGVTCICFMGGDANPNELVDIASWVRKVYPNIRIAWYSGMQNPERYPVFDYIKVGPYIEKLGPLTSKTTNQRLYAKGSALKKMSAYSNEWYDITDRFWKRLNSEAD